MKRQLEGRLLELHLLRASRLKEQQLKEAKESAAVVDKGRETAERAVESARQARQRTESELARLQRVVTELEQANRQAASAVTWHVTLHHLQTRSSLRVTCKQWCFAWDHLPGLTVQ